MLAVRHRIIFLPGLGADQRLFEPQLHVLPSFTVLPWIPHRKNEMLSSYAERMAATITGADTFHLGGVSFGGAVALEMARYCNPSSLILVSSFKSLDSLPRALKLIRCFPSSVLKCLRFFPAVIRWAFGTLNDVQTQTVANMLGDSSSGFLKWALMRILKWSTPRSSVPMYQIHGRMDRIIPIQKVSPNFVVEEGGHLINLTHPDLVNDFILRTINKKF